MDRKSTVVRFSALIKTSWFTRKQKMFSVVINDEERFIDLTELELRLSSRVKGYVKNSVKIVMVFNVIPKGPTFLDQVDEIIKNKDKLGLTIRS